MPWICSNSKCGRTTKGFARGRTLCWVCQQCKDRITNRKIKV